MASRIQSKDSTILSSTTFEASEVKLWSSFIATDASVFKQYSVFAAFGENACKPVYGVEPIF